MNTSVADTIDGMNQFSREVIITIGGFITSSAVVALNSLIESGLDLDVLSISYAFVIPAGALFGGFGAAVGYYFTARWTHTMPSRMMLFNMVTVALSTWFLYRWLGYENLVLEDGRRVADLVPFWEYYKVTTEATELTIGSSGSSTTGELGKLGYVREALQVLGFMVGGFACYRMLVAVDACATCKRYAKETVLLKELPPDRYDEALARGELSIPGLPDQLHKATRRGQGLVGLGLNDYECPRCAAIWVRPTAAISAANHAVTIKLERHGVDPAQWPRQRDALLAGHTGVKRR